MERQLRYNTSEEPIIISKITLDIILKQDKPSDLMALYTFYYYTAKWQSTLKIKATTAYVAQGLQWSEDRVRKAKKKLIKLKLIEDVRVTNKKTGRVKGYYILVKFIWGIVKPQTHDFRESGYCETLGISDTNALQTLNINALQTNIEETKVSSLSQSSKKYVTQKHFNKFWKLYPKRKNNTKSKALAAWLKVCALPIDGTNKESNRPKWKKIKKAIKKHNKSERWVKQPQYIPHTATWLNQFRWNDSDTELNLIEEFNRTNGNGNGSPQRTSGYRRKDGHKYKEYDDVM